MKRKPLSILAALMLVLTVFVTPASANSPSDGLTGRVTGPATTFIIAPGSSFEATFDCLRKAADARATSGEGCWPR